MTSECPCRSYACDPCRCGCGPTCECGEGCGCGAVKTADSAAD